MIEHTQEYVRLRQLLVAVAGVTAVLSIVRLLLPLRLSTDSSKSAVGPTTDFVRRKKTYRATVAPSATLPVHLSRLTVSDLPLVDMNDRGDYLFLSSSREVASRQYLHVFNGKQSTITAESPDIRYILSPGGNVIKRISPIAMSSSIPARISAGPVNFAFNELRFVRRFNDDGSVLNIRGDSVNKVSVSKLMLETMTAPAQTLYSTPNTLFLLERSDHGEVWLKEMMKAKSNDDDILWKLNGSTREKVEFPAGYRTVDRVASTGGTLAATFGSSLDSEPVRSYVMAEGRWKELPIPTGFTFSYVQKVLTNGMILGFVTDGDRNAFRQVVWKGDAVTILSDLPAWPKNGQLSFVTQATRRGDIYVRNVMDTVSGSSEYYLLNLKS